MGASLPLLTRLRRIPRRCLNDLRIIRLLRNWQQVLLAEAENSAMSRLDFRNGVAIEAPATVSLAFLFHEIWINRTYTPPGYEIGPGEIVIDVGANIGVFSLFAATAAPGVKVFSYEPFAESVAWLQKNLAASGIRNVTVCPQAIAGEPGQRTLDVSSESWMSHSLSRAGGKGLTVECISLEGAFAANGLTHCDTLKLDCEGSEYEILESCSADFLASIKRIVGEYHVGPGHRGSGESLRAVLEDRGFRVDMLSPVQVDCGTFAATSRRPHS